MKSTSRQVQILLLAEDEVDVMGAILDRYPEVKILDGTPWNSPADPPLRRSMWTVALLLIFGTRQSSELCPCRSDRTEKYGACR
jgi:hypothetical protein